MPSSLINEPPSIDVIEIRGVPVPFCDLTINLMRGVPADLPGMRAALTELGGERLHDEEYPNALAVSAQFHRAGPAPWKASAEPFVSDLGDYVREDSGSILFLGVEGKTFGITFGSAHHRLPREKRQHGFGLSVAIRSVDPERVRELIKRPLIGISMQEAKKVPSGLPIALFGASEYSELVNRVAGLVDATELGLGRDRPIRMTGTSGLRLSVPADRALLVQVLRRLIAISQRRVPDEFAFIEGIKPVRDTELQQRLDQRLCDGLAGDSTVEVSPAIPAELANLDDEALSFRVTRGVRTAAVMQELDLEKLLDLCRSQHGGTPTIGILRRTTVTMCADLAGKLSLGARHAHEWLAASATLGDRNFFAHEGRWFEGGTEYFAAIDRKIAPLFRSTPSLSLEPWSQKVPRPGSKLEGEGIYNQWIEDLHGREMFLCLDRTGIRTDLHSGKGFEPCDLLGPGNELIHVKPAKRAAPLNQLVAQMLASTEALLQGGDAIRQLRELVASTSENERSLPEGFRPTKIVLAIMLDRSALLDLSTLYPTAKVALAHAVTTLSKWNISFEIIQIPR